VSLEGEPPHLNPLADTLEVIDRVVDKLVYQTLVECQDDQYLPGLADSWDVSSDGTRLSLHLRPSVRWQDDKPLTTIDVQATLEYLMRPQNSSSALHAMLADLEGADMFPERTIRLRLARSSDLTLRALCEIPILPADALRGGSGRLAQLARLPVGTGPFRLASWERGKRIRLVRNKLVDDPEAPLLDEIVFEIDNDSARALTRLRRGELDILPRVAEAHYPEQVSQAALRDVFTLYIERPDRYSFVLLNTRHGALADPAFRHALSLLWDRARFADEFHHGLAHPVGAPTFGSVEPDPFDRGLAAQVLDQAGFRDTNGDGVRDIAGEAIRLLFLLPAGARTLAAEVKSFALDLRRAGILLDSATVDGASFLARVQRGDFELAAMSWDGRTDEDPRLLLGSQGDFQFTGYRSERFLTTIDLLHAAIGARERAPLAQRLAEILAEDRPALFLYRHDIPVLVSRRVHGLAATSDRLDLRAVWVDP
jgi:peptide/nickel transport system substrate-binding protein